ncbi:amino acid ABC transporter permease [Salinarimonas rosea]|uniref:amino acid ABC transporter permease n=1 Tax=Salinarimonas rosea TaxID=552063 RepID=UPI0004181D33|nr:amino acid ABC transporter permease [Salinarimonas rosea]
MKTHVPDVGRGHRLVRGLGSRRSASSLLAWAVALVAAGITLPDIVGWALVDATWVAEDRAGCDPAGACWAFVVNRLPQFAFGFYPPEERWRAAVALAWPLVSLAIALGPGFRRRAAVVAAALAFYPPVAGLLLLGGLLGLPRVPTSQWGGMTMTVFVGTVAFVAAFPIGLGLALARRSSLPALRLLGTGFIEIWRGLPLIAVLFIAVVMVPLALPPGTELPRLVLALVGITLYTSSYLAEVFRGGLQSLGAGQGEAASALGFTYWSAQRYVVVPQALMAVVPGILNTVVALFKDTTYVLVVGLFDFLSIVSAAVADPRWLGLATEGYVFVGLVYWAFCFLLSRVSARIERDIGRGRERGRSA